MRAVLDRIEDGKKAVLLVGDQEEEHIIDVELLPPGCQEGAVLEISISNDSVDSVTLNRDATTESGDRIGKKLARLKSQKFSRFRR